MLTLLRILLIVNTNKQIAKAKRPTISGGAFCL